MDIAVEIKDDFYVIQLPSNIEDIDNLYNEEYFQLLGLRIDHRFSPSSEQIGGGSEYLNEENSKNYFLQLADWVIMNDFSKAITAAIVGNKDTASLAKNNNITSSSSTGESLLSDNNNNNNNITSSSDSNGYWGVNNSSEQTESPVNNVEPTNNEEEEEEEEGEGEDEKDKEELTKNKQDAPVKLTTFHIRKILNDDVEHVFDVDAFDGYTVGKILVEKEKNQTIETLMSGLTYHDIDTIIHDIKIQYDYIVLKNKSVEVSIKNVFYVNNRFLLLSAKETEVVKDELPNKGLYQIIRELVINGNDSEFEKEWAKIENTELWNKYNAIFVNNSENI